ncbi:MAG: type II toxin-antitoxin system RelE/ParE family toxin [Patescibacteria group bacterium]
MEVRFSIKYHYLVVKNDIPKLPLLWKRKIKTAIEEKLATLPELYGKPLRYSLKNYRKLRVGDYRVIFRIEKWMVKVLVIQHRSAAYKSAEKRA